jgi:hypothetical protein
MDDGFKKISETSVFIAAFEGILATDTGSLSSEQLRLLGKAWPDRLWSADLETAEAL